MARYIRLPKTQTRAADAKSAENKRGYCTTDLWEQRAEDEINAINARSGSKILRSLENEIDKQYYMTQARLYGEYLERATAAREQKDYTTASILMRKRDKIRGEIIEQINKYDPHSRLADNYFV